MALIKCKNCGEEISDKSTKCVHCGYDTEYSITHICPECGKEFDNIVCKNCGYKPTAIAKSDNKSNHKHISFNWRLLIKSILGTVVVVFILNMTEGGDLFFIPIVGISITLIVFLTFVFALSGASTEELDDLRASMNSDPYKRAMYRQMKKNNKK